MHSKDREGRTPLHFAARCGHVVFAELLMVNGADVDARCRAGITPLYYAVRKGRTAMAELLLAHGADVNARPQGGDSLLRLVPNEDDMPGLSMGFNHTRDGRVKREALEKLLRQHGCR